MNNISKFCYEKGFIWMSIIFRAWDSIDLYKIVYPYFFLKKVTMPPVPMAPYFSTCSLESYIS